MRLLSVIVAIGLLASATDLVATKTQKKHTTATKKELIRRLNKALAGEFGAVVQYTQHAAAIIDPKYKKTAEELIVHASEELGHATKMSALIQSMGAVPTTDVAKRDTATDPQKMIDQDLAGERDAIKKYKELIAMATELGEDAARLLLTEVVAKEEEHVRDLSGAPAH